jgi:hypothetical protein
MKVNTKLGGVNVKLQDRPQAALPLLSNKPFMIFGEHPQDPPAGTNTRLQLPSLDSNIGGCRPLAPPYELLCAAPSGASGLTVLAGGAGPAYGDQ